MKINWKVRVKNPYFWIGLIGVLLTSMGAKPEMFTSWSVLIDYLKEFLGNPYVLGTSILAIIGVLLDPTTKGLCDSTKALQYTKPNEE